MFTGVDVFLKIVHVLVGDGGAVVCGVAFSSEPSWFETLAKAIPVQFVRW